MRSPRSLLLLPWLAGVLALGGCAENSATDAGVPEPTDAGITRDAAAADAEPPAEDAGSAPDAELPDSGEVRPPDICDDLGLARQPMRDGDAAFMFGDVAGDFSVTELDGTQWTLGEHWTGCESYVFLAYIPTSGPTEEQLFGSSVTPLVESTPINAHFFFVSAEGTEALRRTRVEAVRDRIERLLAMYDEPTQARQRARFHYVVDHAQGVAGSVGGFFTDYLTYAVAPGSVVDLGDRGMAPPPPPFAVGIARDQRWDDGGNMAQYVGGRPAFAMAGFLPHFYGYKASIRDARAAERGATELEMVHETTTARTLVRELELPGAAAMAGFDTFEADIRVVCNHRNVFGCSEWDRIGYIHLCGDATCQTAEELVRWITPYWRRGEQHFVIDASAMLGLVKDGGRRWFRVILGPDWERGTEWDVEVVLRLAQRGSGLRSTGVVHAFNGGNFDANYNTRDPFLFTPPASARKVELVVILSGHGQDGTTNCAEWCDHRHHFSVNGHALPEIRHEGSIGSIAGCGRGAARGVPPGQFGNWAPERAYWCPGMPVDPIRIDLTNDVVLGQENRLEYSATLGASGAPGGGNIELSTYVVWSE